MKHLWMSKLVSIGLKLTEKNLTLLSNPVFFILLIVKTKCIIFYFRPCCFELIYFCRTNM